MAIKVECIAIPAPITSDRFPRLMISKETNAIYLITGMNNSKTMNGFCVKNGGGSVIGNDYLTLVAPQFTDYHGTITLQNK